MGTWRTLHPRRILHAPGAFSVHGGVLPGEPSTQPIVPHMSSLQAPLFLKELIMQLCFRLNTEIILIIATDLFSR